MRANLVDARDTSNANAALTAMTNLVINVMLLALHAVNDRLQAHDSAIEKITKEMAKRYVKDKRTIILCVIAANQDMSTSDAIQMAMKYDSKGKRTFGVLTKVPHFPPTLLTPTSD